MSARDKIIKAVLSLGGGILKRAEDIVLLETLFFLESLGQPPTSRGVWQAYQSSLRVFGELQRAQVDDDLLFSLKRAWQRARKKGWVRLLKEETFLRPAITEAGWRRLRHVFPVYDAKRFWDGRIYLITYDIPEERKRGREDLRRLLKKMGAGALQLSVFLTPYDPRGNLKKLLDGTGLADRVIVSDLGEDGNIGGRDLGSLLDEIFHLTELNRRYRRFLEDFSSGGLSAAEKMAAVVRFYEILTEDPQIPFALLPKGWSGDKAYCLCQKLLGFKEKKPMHYN